MKWAYAVTTVPDRRTTTLPRTLASLAAAGFDRPRLSVDGDHDAPGWYTEFGGRVSDVTCRGTGGPVGVFGHWVMTVAETYLRDPKADVYAVFQDDAVFCRNVRPYFDRLGFPERGYFNLYTWKSNHVRKPSAGFRGWYKSNQLGRGAVALIFPRAAVVPLLTSRGFAEKPREVAKPRKSVDGAIQNVLVKTGWTEYCHGPGLCQHTGDVSSCGNVSGRPLSPDFPGEDFDCMSLLG